MRRRRFPAALHQQTRAVAEAVEQLRELGAQYGRAEIKTIPFVRVYLLKTSLTRFSRWHSPMILLQYTY